MRATALLIPLSLATFLVPPPCNAGPPGATLTGVVADHAGHVLAGAEVQLLNMTTGTIATVHSGDDGHYRLANLDTTVAYVLAVRCIGFAPQVRMHIRASARDTLTLPFMLRPIPAHLSPPARGAVDTATALPPGTLLFDAHRP